MTSRMARAQRLAPWMVGAFFALPVLLVSYPPMADLPLHEASVGLLRHWGDARFAPHTLYALNLGHANQLFSFLVLLLSFAVPIGWASKIVVAGALFALPLAAAHFADHVRSPRWTALLVAPIGIGWLFFWGLVQNILGLVALLWLLPAIDRFARSPTARGAAFMCGSFLLLHFAHQAMQLVACAALALCALGSPVRVRPTLLRAMPIAFCIALALAARRYSESIAGPRHMRTPLFFYYTLSHKLTTIPGVLFGGYEPYVRNLMFVLALGAVVLLGLDRLRGRAPHPRRSLAEIACALRFELLGLTLFALYLVAPANVHSTTLVYHRFLPPAWAILAVCAGAGSTVVRPLAIAACGIVPVASMLISWPIFADGNRVYADLDRLIDRIEIGSAIVGLNLGPDPEHRLWVPIVAEGHIVALRGGRSLFDYTQSPTSPITQRPEKQWTEVTDRLESHPYEFRPEWDLTHYRYLLVATPQPGLGAAVGMAIEKQARLIGHEGSWFLFESTLPVGPVDANEVPLPRPRPPNLLKLLDRVAHAAQEGPPAPTGPAVEP